MNYSVHDDVMKSCRHAATISRLKYQGLERGLVPAASSETATVTFIKFSGKTYAVTAWHVIEIFKKLAEADGVPFEGYSCIQAPGVAILGPFLRPPAELNSAQPDIAICPVHSDLPKRINKAPFEIHAKDDAKWPVQFAIAIGFPTTSKNEVKGDIGATRLGLPCVHAVAEGLGALGTSDQIQFFSELAERPNISSLSGMSGGPVFWSGEDSYGLIGLVKEALDVSPVEGEDSFFNEPKVNFVCQRVDYEILRRWTNFIDDNWQIERNKICETIKLADPRQ